MPRDGYSRYYGRPRYRGLSAVEPSGYRMSDGLEAGGGAAAPPTLFSHGTTFAATAQFRAIAEDREEDQTYVAVRNDEVLFEQAAVREFEPTSAIHLAGRASSKPFKAENEEFFRYKFQLFDAKLNQMRAMIVDRRHYKAPNKETLSFIASLVRLFCDVTVRFWRLNGDVENRLRFTRALQDGMHMFCAIEAFLLAEILKSHDSDSPAAYASKRSQIFKVRNTFRIFVQNMPLYDRLFHWGFQVSHNRLFDFLAQFPGLAIIFAFPPTENIVGSRTLAVNSILRNLFEGTLVGRRISGNRQALVTDNPNAYAQNLAAEGNGFETANRQQHGTYIGRRKTNAFRLEHRLQTDESVVRTFQASPAATMLNNGVEHVLNNLASHWRNALYQENGNFGHQRQELLDPIQTLRFHMPVVLVTLTNLRGRNNFDGDVVGPLMRRLEAFDPGAATAIHSSDVEVGDWVANDITKTCAIARQLASSLLQHVDPICAGIPTRASAFQAWVEAILDSIDDLENEAHGVRMLVASVDQGIRLGYQLIKLANWEIPKDSHLEHAIIAYLNSTVAGGGSTGDIDRVCIQCALDRLAPKDARTLQELLRTGHGRSRAAELLVGRVRTLLHRELRRKAIDQRIRELSMGEPIHESSMARDDWYVVQSDTGGGIFKYKCHSGGKLRFKDLNSGDTVLIERNPTLAIRQYIPVAESISRAQKAYMNLELDYLKRFSYNAYMEFGSGDVDGSLRTQLRRLAVVAQLQSYELDSSRRMVLSEFLHRPEETVYSVKACRPQNLIVIGGGPTGLITAIHSIQSCLMSGGFVTLYESRDTYKKEAASFERAQVVRLDARWISMLRFHLGTAFENQFIPLRGETDAHLGNTIPEQGFVELTIKGLETILHEEAIRLRSRGLMNYYTGSGIDFDMTRGYFSKKGSKLKVGDNIRMGNERFRVIGLLYPRPVEAGQVILGQEYDILFPRDERIATYRLVEAYPDFDFYGFAAMQQMIGLPNALRGPFNRFQVFPKGLASVEPHSIVLKRMDGRSEQITIDFQGVKEESFQLDVYDSHVLIAAGKPKNTDEHFPVTTDEPYGVCCIEGLKVSMIMHLFGEKRFDVGNFSKWNMGFADDLRSQNDQNTRLVGDFTKTVALPPVIKEMAKRLGISRGNTVRTVWVRYIEKTIAEEGLDHSGMVERLNRYFRELVQRAKHTEDIVAARLTHDGGTSVPPARLGFQRHRLQTRYFEVGDNYYLGMELPREFETWKRTAINEVLPSPQHDRIRRKLRSIFDRLWFEATIEVVNRADVFNPDGRIQIPTFYLIPSLSHAHLADMLVGEAFTLASPDESKFRITLRDGNFVHLVAPNNQSFTLPSRTKVKAEDGSIRTAGEEGMQMIEPVEVFEVISRASARGVSLVRTSEGYVFELSDKLPVWRQSDLARAADGISESKVALATFPVALKVNVRTVRILRAEGNDGYITGFIGDAQASPHFMRYSGLTGACVNAMSFNNLVAQAVAGVNFADRVRRYALETNWSNGEVVERGTGHNFGEDGFCRPGFTFKSMVDYVYSRVDEHYILGEDIDTALTRDWKYKLSAGLVPRGLENDSLFRDALFKQLLLTVKAKFVDKAEQILEVDELSDAQVSSIEVAMEIIGKRFKGGFETDPSRAFTSLEPYTADILQSIAVVAQGTVEALKQTIDYSYELRSKNARVSSELFHQPKSVDSFIDDFALEAQMFANGLTQSVAIAAASLALSLLRREEGDSSSSLSRVVPVVLSALNIDTSFGTMTNVSRYRNRNEEARVIFFDEKLPRILKGVFSLMSMEKRSDPSIPNPFIEELEMKTQNFFHKARYYGYTDAQLDEFRREYQNLVSTIHSYRSVLHFIKRLLKYFIPEVFQENPYLKDELVGVYMTLNEYLHLMRQKHTGGQVTGAFELYNELLRFRPRLEQSLQRGTIRFGFLKRRPWHQWSIFVGIRYILSNFGLWKTMSTETRRVLNKLEAVSAAGEGVFLRRELRDFQELYYAGRESEITSLLFSSATVVFYASFFFTLFGLVGLASGVDEETGDLEWETVQFLLDLSGFTTVFSIFGATLATFHQCRKILILGGLHKRLGQGRKIQGRLELVRYLTTAEQMLSVLRISITIAAAVSLIWTLYLTSTGKENDLPLYVAVVAVVAGLATVILFFIIELFVRYGLDPQLGPLVLEPFMDEIQALKQRFVDPRAGGVGVETQQNVEREVWEYTAREFIHQYRFDAVFSSDRFGPIFQYLQAGAPRR